MEEKLRALFHTLWTRAVGTPGYVKADWVELERSLSARSSFIDVAKKEDAVKWAGENIASRFLNRRSTDAKNTKPCVPDNLSCYLRQLYDEGSLAALHKAAEHLRQQSTQNKTAEELALEINKLEIS